MGRVNVILVPSSIIPLSPTTVAPVATGTRFTVRSAMNDVPRASGDNRTVGGQETNRGGTRRTDRTGYAPRSGRTGRSSGADRTCRSGRANPANRTGRTDRTDGPLGAYRTGGTGRAGGADRALNRTRASGTAHRRRTKDFVVYQILERNRTVGKIAALTRQGLNGGL